MPSATREDRPFRPVARRTRPFCNVPDCPSSRYFGTFSVQQPDVVAGAAEGNQDDLASGGGGEDFTLANLERDVARMQGSLLTIGFGLTDAENALRETGSPGYRETAYIGAYSLEERRNVAGDLEKIKKEMDGVRNLMGGVTARIVNVCSRVRMLRSLEVGGVAHVGGGDDGGEDEGDGGVAMDMGGGAGERDQSADGGGEGEQMD